MSNRQFRWAVLLCKFDQEPLPVPFFSNYVSGTAVGSLNDYWRTMSYGKLDMSSCTIYGWETMPFPLDQAFLGSSRSEKVATCKRAFQIGFDSRARQLGLGFQAEAYVTSEVSRLLSHDGFLVVLGANQGGSGHAGGADVLLDMNAFRPAYVEHETGHALGLDHSHDTNPDPWDKDNDSAPGAYGDSHDIMSAENWAGLPATFSTVNGPAGPSLNALQREKMGWLPPERITSYTHTRDETWSVQLMLAGLNNPEAPGALMVRIKATGFAPLLDVDYCLEYRPRTGWDAGAATDAVVVHMVAPGDVPRIVWSARNDQDWQAGDLFVDLARQLAISIVFIAPDRSSASVYISGGTASLPTLSVSRSLRRKTRLKDGLRAIAAAPLQSDSLRARLLTHPPQFS
jgi:M6 family metalloprotease-like protein